MMFFILLDVKAELTPGTIYWNNSVLQTESVQVLGEVIFSDQYIDDIHLNHQMCRVKTSIPLK